MFDAWVDQLDDIEIPLDDAGLTRAIDALNRLQAKVAVAVGRFDVRQLWTRRGRRR